MKLFFPFRPAVGLVAAGFFLAAAARAVQPPEPLRPPAVPLVACDPYFSIWSPADKLTDADTMHWTGAPHRLAGRVQIDGKNFRLLGATPADVPALPQTAVEVLPTRTIYSFAGAGIQLTLTFLQPALPDDLMLYSRPVVYVICDFVNTDGREHQVGFQFTANGEISRDQNAQELTAAVTGGDGSDFWFNVIRIGTTEQPVLVKKGDEVRIDWGQLLVAARADEASASYPSEISPDGKYSSAVATLDFAPFKVASQPVSRMLMLAYDDEFSIQYFGKNLRPYWRRKGDDATALLKKSAQEYASLKKRCEQFDAEFMADMRQAGGEKFARLCALIYRQVVAGCKVVCDENGQPLLFPKENTSNGCIGTVDVIYPMSPFCLLFSPSLTKAMLVPPLDYAASPRWKFPFAPHDLGTYPQANGQVYGGGERTAQHQMPVEESANLIILVTALAEREGNADFAAHYWPVLAKWAAYLKEKGFDPELQLCTDDFAGHLAHNVNLSAKAIIALGAFGKLCEMRGENEQAKEFTTLAKSFATRWVKEADAGNHFRLAFDRPDSWSQKYNMIWDRVLGLGLFPQAAREKELKFYPAMMNRYGLSLDSRKPYAELPWTFWTAALTGNDADFQGLLAPIYDYVNATPSRVPLADFYWTATAREAGMHARPVLGGIFLKPLLDETLARKWFARDVTKAAGWAPLPTPPKIIPIVPTAETEPAVWRFTEKSPDESWAQPGFDASAWLTGKSGFGTTGTPGAVIGTDWHSADLWLRREVTLPKGDWSRLHFRVYHDEDVEIYVNGILAAKAGGYATDYVLLPVAKEALAALKSGEKILLAVHCHQTIGGQGVDVGLVEIAD
jgi:Domain of unknown function (DUF4965)/Domain of unknown function (DUF1793)/Domain of unknown function (DUF5127)/Domain of unknown function (DUF4964)